MKENTPTTTELSDNTSGALGKYCVRKRPKSLKGTTFKFQTGCGAIYITINGDMVGLFELHIAMGKAGGCASSQCQAIGRMVSLAWRSGVPASQVVKELLGISCHLPAGYGENRVLSCSDSIAMAIQSYLAAGGQEINTEKKNHIRGACPECGGRLIPEEGCFKCRCGFYVC
jgi:ribonucleoside-diphosphate reductase alpha chain